MACLAVYVTSLDGHEPGEGVDGSEDEVGRKGWVV